MAIGAFKSAVLFIFIYFLTLSCRRPAGRSFPGDFHQPSGDRQDPPAGGWRDHHGPQGQRPQRGPGPGLLRPLQGGSATSAEADAPAAATSVKRPHKGTGEGARWDAAALLRARRVCLSRSAARCSAAQGTLEGWREGGRWGDICRC